MNKNKVSKNVGGGVTDFFFWGGGPPPPNGPAGNPDSASSSSLNSPNPRREFQGNGIITPIFDNRGIDRCMMMIA